MKMKTKFNLIWVAALLPLFLFLLSSSYALNMNISSQMHAFLSLLPAARVSCSPNILSVGSNVNWIICRIELEGENVNRIDLNSVVLGRKDSSCSVSAEKNFFETSDFDRNGIGDALVRFNRSIFEKNCIGEISTPTDFQLMLSGKVGIFPFDGTDNLRVLPSCSAGPVHFAEINSSRFSQGSIYKIEGIVTAKYDPSFTRFSGFYTCGNDNLIGDGSFYTEGILKVPKTIDFFLFKIPITERQTVKISGIFTGFDGCSADSSIVQCTGKGKLVMFNERTVETKRFDLPFMMFSINRTKNPNKADVIGGEFFNDKLDVKDISITRVRVS